MSRDGDGSGLVSVVVPTYYRNDRLREALESVAAQEYEPVETIVVDSAEDGHARPVAAEFPAVEYASTDRDEGPQAARSLGAERASGEYVQFLDDDDRLAPDKLRKQVALLDPPVGVVYCGMDDEDRGEVLPNPAVRGDVLAYALEMRTFPCIYSTMLVDADVVEDLLPLGHRHGADDTATKIDLALRTRFDFVAEPLIVRGRTDTSLSASWAYLEGRKRVIADFDDIYRRFPREVRRRAVRETYSQIGRKLLDEQGWSPAATVAFARAAYYTPDDRVDYVGECLASVFGRRGVRVADRLRS
ncbi:glycosyltransferase family 2 protein [Halorussus marinus]|uniref:glycosyltransferase family 2 protein n=1 Tax=Halorussus marinus TaxID=2505976 RepID=UPI00106EF7D0|nr:glycosyltransferase family 2 protein [Halorussus marinus]